MSAIWLPLSTMSETDGLLTGAAGRLAATSGVVHGNCAMRRMPCHGGAASNVSSEVLMYEVARSPHPVTFLFPILLAAAACMSQARQIAAEAPAAQAAAVDTAVSGDAGILGVLHAANIGETSAANIAKDRSNDSAVKAFADMMIADHTKADQQGMALARQIGVTPAPASATLTRLQNFEEDSLKASERGAAFDRLYLAQQIDAHQRVLDLINASIPKAQHAELKTALETQVKPMVEAHLAKAKAIISRP
jgi:putative membrane protein